MRVDLALVGFGHVGRRFARLLEEVAPRLDFSWRIAGIATGRHGCAWDAAGLDVRAALASVEAGRPLPGAAGCTTRDVIARLGTSHADLRVVIETTTLDITAGQPAIDHVRAAFAAGCHVATANKGPAAFAYAALRDDARAAGVSFLFEGAVMDGVPIFNLARETLPATEIVGFRGVVNSTTNHIISALEDGEAFEPALARMQEAGIAEADPSLDVDGWDAAAKAAALANVLMDAGVTPHDVRRQGIGPGTGEAVRRALTAGRRLRLVAAARRGAGGAVEMTVAPVELPATDLLAGLRGQANALVLETDMLGEIAICQLAGDLTQTAYALLSDLVTIVRREAPAAAPPHRIP